MDYGKLTALRRSHPAWRLLLASHAPLVASFLHEVFIAPNVRALSQAALRSKLDDVLFRLREAEGADAFPRTADHYLDEWADEEHGWLRKYYPPDSDEPHFDVTPGAERAIEWLVALGRRPFVATESRIMTVFELLRQIVEGTTLDSGARLAELERRRRELDDEIAAVRGGRVEVMDAARVKDRFLQMADTARALLGDFREVEHNFRELDRGVREKIATWDHGKGALLAEIFGERDAINDSDQGKTFRAFWDFLMSPERQEELTRLLETVLALPAVAALAPDARLRRVHYDWLEAGDVAQRTVARLSRQLRRYLDDQALLENRRVMQLIRGIEQGALAVRSNPPTGPFTDIDEPAPSVELPMERPLFSVPLKPNITARPSLADGEAIPDDALFDQVFVDREVLAQRIRKALQERPQVSLAEVVAAHPLEHGLAELVAYLGLAADDRRAQIDERRTHAIDWIDREGCLRRATLPVVVFSR
jgi:hypothetical protein